MSITKIITADLDLNMGSIVVLTEREGNRSFPIFIGYFEATAIDRHIRGITPPRPLTHDLLAALIQQLGGTLEKIVINSLKDNTFFARLHIRTETGVIVEIDARPSDALALAVRTKARILVSPSVLDAAAI